MSLMFGMDPARELRRMQRVMAQAFPEFEYAAAPAGLLTAGEGAKAADFSPRTDLRETENTYDIICELPGVKKEDVKVDLSGNLLTLSGQKRHMEEKKGDTWHSIERRYGQFSRSFTLPEGVDANKVCAEYNNGVLTISVPKPPALKAATEVKRIDIK
eukprot:m51a1_g223 hypothetical protein (158) ;mRNA; f:51340-51902